MKLKYTLCGRKMEIKSLGLFSKTLDSKYFDISCNYRAGKMSSSNVCCDFLISSFNPGDSCRNSKTWNWQR